MDKDIKWSGWAILVMFLLLPAIVTWEAYVVIIVWRWYAPEIWGTLSLKNAVGVILVFIMVKTPERTKEPIKVLLMAVLFPLILLWLAWLLLFFV